MPPRRRRDRSWPIFLACGFFFLLGLAVLVGKLPWELLALYVPTSLATLSAYAIDKSAARNGRRRIRESRLHLLAVAGGWPGALLAQGVLRHKTRKPAFLGLFWLSVAANCALLAAATINWHGIVATHAFP